MLKIIVAFVVLLIHKILHSWKGYNYLYKQAPGGQLHLWLWPDVYLHVWSASSFLRRKANVDRPQYHWLSHYGWHKQNVVPHVTMSWAYVATMIVILSRQFVYTHTHMPVATSKHKQCISSVAINYSHPKLNSRLMSRHKTNHKVLRNFPDCSRNWSQGMKWRRSERSRQTPFHTEGHTVATNRSTTAQSQCPYNILYNADILLRMDPYTTVLPHTYSPIYHPNTKVSTFTAREQFGQQSIIHTCTCALQR